MKEKLVITQTILVEGRYDKVKLDSFIDGFILPVHGFNIFTDRELQQLIRKLAKEKGILIVMDSDAAGFKIRGFISGLVPTEEITHVYIPDVVGKESRKKTPSKEGTLGVEGLSISLLKEAFENAGITTHSLNQPKAVKKEITQMDLYEMGLAGGRGSREKRQQLYAFLGLPEKISTRQALGVLNEILTREELQRYVAKIE